MADTTRTDPQPLQREDLTPEAREPRDDSTGLGFGSFYPDPLRQDDDAPLLGTALPESEAAPEGGRTPTQTAMPSAFERVPNQTYRDFRKDDQQAGDDMLRPTTEDPAKD